MRAAVFDMDGTLLDTWPAIYRCINQVVAENGREPFAPEELKPLVGTFIGDIFGRKGVDPAKGRPRYRELYMSTYRRDSAAYHGSVEMLASLKRRGIKTAVITMRIGGVARAILDDFGHGKYLDIVLGEDEVTRPKPDPEHVLAALGRLGVEPRDACVVGDTEFDMEAGSRAGCMPIGVSWGYGKPSNAGDVRVVHSFDELEKAIIE
jgi:HAD superfamily hydrolase (TIGR01509 family)